MGSEGRFRAGSFSEERVVPLLEGEADGLVAVRRVLEHREAGAHLRQRDALTPSVGAESIVTPAAPKPWSSRIWVNTPPAEWPMMIGGDSSSPTIPSRRSMIAGTVRRSIGVGGRRSAPRPRPRTRGRRGRSRAAPCSRSARSTAPNCGGDREPWTRTIVSGVDGGRTHGRALSFVAFRKLESRWMA